MIRTIKLYGDLAEICGDSIRLYATCLYEVIAGIKANYPKTIELFEGGKCHVHAGIERDDKTDWLTDKNCNELLGDVATIHFAIAITGSGLALAKVIYGALMATGIGMVAAIALTAIAMVAIHVAVGMAVTAITKMFAPKPSLKEKESKDEKSYNLNGPKQQRGIGATVPLLYGRYRGGSCIISQTIMSERLIMAMPDTITLRPGINTFNVLANDGASAGAWVKSVTFGSNTWTSTGTGVSPTWNIFNSANTITIGADGLITVNMVTPPTYTAEVSLTYTATKSGVFGDGDSATQSSNTCRIRYPVEQVVVNDSGSDSGGDSGASGDSGGASGGDAAGAGTGTA